MCTVQCWTGTPSQRSRWRFETCGAVDHEELGPPEAALLQIVQHGAPGFSAFGQAVDKKRGCGFAPRVSEVVDPVKQLAAVGPREVGFHGVSRYGV